MGLFRPIRSQHKWMMTTSFTCSTGLGDKLMPLLLPGMFWRLFCATPERAVCYRWWRVALKHREEPSYHLYSQQRGERCARWPFGELCQDGGSGAPLPKQRPSHVSYINLYALVQHFKVNIISKVSSQIFFLSHSLSKCIKAHFIEILLRTAVHHALWFIMQIHSTRSRFPLYSGDTCMRTAAFVLLHGQTDTQ